jgi:hypothetical protein
MLIEHFAQVGDGNLWVTTQARSVCSIQQLARVIVLNGRLLQQSVSTFVVAALAQAAPCRTRRLVLIALVTFARGVA